ncbi:hypothetical protein [Hydrogenophaga sp.]|uniref:hypothetical protein n=1 Tax=Hydrogenophaga sp. TaxID=1904254 RepID=UPI00271964B3|nr:hypothetical protein [Hydrogenophaga sp.]MDO8903127.1 hypothetical protein [Hydrogenophaga sp.]
MKAMHRSSLIALAALALCIPRTGMGESVLVSGAGSTGASASVDIRIIVPPVMQVLENTHPEQLGVAVDGQWSAQQKLVVMSTMKRGFCVTLRLATPQVEGWQLHSLQQGGVTLSTVADGYQVCTARAGRYTLLLQHAFAAESTVAGDALRWPVRTDLTAL